MAVTAQLKIIWTEKCKQHQIEQIEQILSFELKDSKIKKKFYRAGTVRQLIDWSVDAK